MKVKLVLWENQLNMHKLLHYQHIKSPGTDYPDWIQEYSHHSCALRGLRQTVSGF
jgi:hypothetical protein